MSVCLTVCQELFKAAAEKCWVHNIHSLLSQGDLYCYARYEFYYARWKIDISFAHDLYFMSDIRIYALWWTKAVLQFMSIIYKRGIALAVREAYGLLCQRSTHSWSFSRPLRFMFLSQEYWLSLHSHPGLLEDLPIQPEARSSGSCGKSCGLDC